jgi:DNA primase
MSAREQARGAAGRTADDWVERVREASDIVEIVGEVVPLKRMGRNWSGLCPFHQEKTPSFSVSGERQLYHCFSCKAGGDVFRFVQEQEKVDFLEAVSLLSRRAGIPVPERRGEHGGGRATLVEALDLAAEAYEQWLRDPDRGASARSYLERRGIGDSAMRAFRLGLAPEGWTNLADRLRNKVAPEVLVQAGLVVRREGDASRGVYDRFRNRLMVPLIASGGAVVGFGARALGEDPPKYLNSPETAVYRKSAYLYGLDRARRAVTPEGEIVVVEGYFDTIALHQAGVENTVATSGTALTAEHARALRRIVPRVALTYDGDAAGREAAMRSIGLLLAEGLEVRIVEVPAGEDPDTMVRARGLAGWNEVRERAYDPVEFVHRHVLRAGLSSGAARSDAEERAIRAVVALASGIPDLVRKRGLIERAAEVLGVRADVIARVASLHRKGQSVENPVRAAVRERHQVEETLERALLSSLLLAPEVLGEARSRLSPEDFRDPACRELALWMWAGNEALPEHEPAASLGRELALAPAGNLDFAAAAHGGIRRMVVRRLEQQMKDCKNRLKQEGGGEEAARLMQEIHEIARSLRDLSA